MADVDDDEGEAALIEDSAQEDSASSRSQCTVCHPSMPVTRLGFLHVHGPVLNHCPGSRKPPTPVNTCQHGNIPDILDPVQAFKLRRFSSLGCLSMQKQSAHHFRPLHCQCNGNGQLELSLAVHSLCSHVHCLLHTI